MKTLTSISKQALNQTNVSNQYNLGDTYQDEKGWWWVYSQAGEALSAHAILTVDEDKLSATATASGTATATYDGVPYNQEAIINKTSGFGTAGDYQDYMGVVTAGTAKGETFTIKNNSANAAYLVDPLTNHPEAIKAFTPNIVIETPSGSSRVPVGVTSVAVTKDYYFWRQVSGYAALLTDIPQEGLEGRPVVTGGGVAGQGLLSLSVSYRPVVGHIVVGSSAENSSCWVKLVSML